MLRQYIHALRGFATLRAAAGGGGAQDCSGTITVEEALKAEQDRYAAQMKGDVGAMQRLIGDDLVYIHSSTVQAEDRTLNLLFHAVYAKRAAGIQFVSWQATKLPA